MAKSPRFINFSELSDELRHFIEAGAKIFPIDTFESLPNEKTYEFYRVLSGDHKNEIYGWSELDSKYVLIGADDRDIRWDDVQYKPTEFTPINHNHTLLEIIDFPSNMPPSNHTHTENEITDLDKYTKLEIDGALSGKANSVHSHFESDIVDLDKYTKAEIDDALSGKVDKVDGKGLSTNDFTTSDKNKLDSLSENASLNYTSMQEALNNHKTSSDHDGRYYTKTDLDTILSGKADKTVVNGHINSSTIHVTQDDKDTWNSKANSVHTHSESEIIDLTTTLSGKADKTVVSGHTDNTTIHVTQDDKDTWNTVSNKVDNSRVLTDVPIGAKFTDTTYGIATTSTSGLMSSTDKTNLDSNTTARHTHSNKSVLDKFTEVDNKPFYNGEEIGTGIGIGTNLNLKVSRQYDTYEDLPTNPDIGYMCLVGSDLYIFTEEGWVNAGKLTEINLDIYTNIDGGLFTDEYGVIIGESALEALQDHTTDEDTHANLIIDGTEV